MNQPTPSSTARPAEQAHQPSASGKPVFGFLLGGTTLGIFIGCLLLCAGAGPPHLIIIAMSIAGAFTGGFLEAIWPAPSASSALHPQTHSTEHECRRCGELFPPAPIICPMCGHAEKRRNKT